eukprot:604601-Rhodomonas_salina.8
MVLPGHGRVGGRRGVDGVTLSAGYALPPYCYTRSSILPLVATWCSAATRIGVAPLVLTRCYLVRVGELKGRYRLVVTVMLYTTLHDEPEIAADVLVVNGSALPALVAATMSLMALQHCALNGSAVLQPTAVAQALSG